jgi:protein-L-isoaspartate(D-aspartate) O-methyltransferase
MNPASADDHFTVLRLAMVETQIAGRGIKDNRVLDAMRNIPRHLFIPEDLSDRAYEDGPLPIGWDQTISQPYIVGYMTELLELKPSDRVLEIGTGSGYQTAVMAQLVREVYTVETINPLFQKTRDQLMRFGYRNIQYRHSDGSGGWPEEAPFEKIMVAAAAENIPQALIDQLKEGGRLMMPVGRFEQQLKLGVKKHGIFTAIETIPVRFVRLVQTREKEKGGKYHEEEKGQDN